MKTRNCKLKSGRRAFIDAAYQGAGAPRSPETAGFTLVEMLVAVAVVVVMMTLFTTIFQLATGAMQKQKGLAENDQRVRLVVTMLRNDLRTSKTDPVTGNPAQYRTFRWLVPIAPGDVTTPPAVPAGSTIDVVNDRQGYFYISEGDPFDDT